MRVIVIGLIFFLLSLTIIANSQENEQNFLHITPDNIGQLQQIAILEYDLDGTIKAVSHLEFHPTQPLLLSQEFNETIRIWDLRQFEFVEALPLPTEYSTAFAMSPDGENMVYGGWDFEQQPDFATLNLWNFEQNENELIVRDWQFSIKEVTYNRDGSMFAAYGWQHDGQIRLWSSDDLSEPIPLSGHGENVSHIAFTEDNHLVTSGEDREVRIWDVQSQEIIRIIDGYFFVVHPSEPIIVVSDVNTLGDKPSTTLYDIDQPDVSVIRNFEGLPFAFSPAGDIVAVTSDGLWLNNFETGERLAKLSDYGSRTIAFSPDGRMIATTENLGTISIWAIPEG